MFTFDLRPDGGEPIELKATSRDVYMWERAGRGRTLRAFAESLSIESCYQLAHIAARRQQVFDGTLEEFVERFDLDMSDDDDEAAGDDPDPFPPAPSPGG